MLQRISGLLAKPIHFIAALVVVCMILLATSQIVFRYVLSVSVPWTEEVARVFFVWMIFFGTCLVEEDGSQIRTQLVVENLPRPLQLVWETVITLNSIAFQAILFVGGILSWDSAEWIALGSLSWLSYRVFFIPVYIASPMCIFFMINNLVIRKRRLYPKAEGTA